MFWWKSFFSKGASDAQMNSELHFHIDEQTEANIAAGMSPEEARRRAILEFGGHEQLKEELRKWVAKEIGAMAKPDDIRFTDGLPKTRSGKIMRRLLRELAGSGEVKGDTTTLEDFTVLTKLRADED